MENNYVPVKTGTYEMIIGKVTYYVNTFCNANGYETAEEKLIRYVSERIAHDTKTPENAVI